MATESIPVSRPNLGPRELAAVQKVFDSGWLGHGATVIDFEAALSTRLGGRRVVAVSTGTAALHLALEALNIGVGDEVILPSLTFCSCPQVVTQLGATPVFCDVSEHSLTMDVRDVRSCLSSRTRAIMPVHFCSCICDIASLQDIARDAEIAVVEDAAHAFGCYRHDTPVGSFGDITCFSFDPIKNITCGEGGAIVLPDGKLAEEIARKRILGMDRDGWRRNNEGWGFGYAVTTQGFRYHMSNINAAIGLTQLSRFGELAQRRRRIALKYHAMLGDIEDLRLPAWDLATVVPFAFMLRVRRGLRDDLREHLLHAGVQTAVHYPPNHLQPAFEKYRRVLPVTENAASELMTIPLFPTMSDGEIEHVGEEIRTFFGAAKLAATQPISIDKDHPWM